MEKYWNFIWFHAIIYRNVGFNFHENGDIKKLLNIILWNLPEIKIDLC